MSVLEVAVVEIESERLIVLAAYECEGAGAAEEKPIGTVMMENVVAVESHTLLSLL